MDKTTTKRFNSDVKIYVNDEPIYANIKDFVKGNDKTIIMNNTGMEDVNGTPIFDMDGLDAKSKFGEEKKNGKYIVYYSSYKGMYRVKNNITDMSLYYLMGAFEVSVVV